MKKGKGKRAKYDWPTIRHEYVTGPGGDEKIILDDLAEKWGIPPKYLRKVSAREGWTRLRREWVAKEAQLRGDKSAHKVASQKAKLADGALMVAMMIPGKYRPLVEKMQKAPAKDWMEEPEIKKLSPSDYEKLVKIWLVLKGEAADRVEVEVTDRDRKMAAAYWKARREMAEEEGENEGK